MPAILLAPMSSQNCPEGSQMGKAACALWVGGVSLLSPANHCATSQSWPSKSSCIWQRVDLKALSSKCVQLPCDVA